jgi:hypothetical protein
MLVMCASWGFAEMFVATDPMPPSYRGTADHR